MAGTQRTPWDLAGDQIHRARHVEDLRSAAKECRACDLWERATQTVFGEGRKRADDAGRRAARERRGPRRAAIRRARREAARRAPSRTPASSGPRPTSPTWSSTSAGSHVEPGASTRSRTVVRSRPAGHGSIARSRSCSRASSSASAPPRRRHCWERSSASPATGPLRPVAACAARARHGAPVRHPAGRGRGGPSRGVRAAGRGSSRRRGRARRRRAVGLAARQVASPSGAVPGEADARRAGRSLRPTRIAARSGHARCAAAGRLGSCRRARRSRPGRARRGPKTSCSRSTYLPVATLPSRTTSQRSSRGWPPRARARRAAAARV